MPFGGPTAKLHCSRSLPYLPTHFSTEAGPLTAKSSLTRLFHWLGLKKSENGRKWRQNGILKILQRILTKRTKKRKGKISSDQFICIPSLYLYEKFPSGLSSFDIKTRFFRRTTSDSGLNYKCTYDQPLAKPECSYKVTLDGVQFNLDDLFVECSKEEASNLKRSELRNFKGTKVEFYEGSGKVSSMKPMQNTPNCSGENREKAHIKMSRIKDSPLRNGDLTAQMVEDRVPDHTRRSFVHEREEGGYNLFRPLSRGKAPKQRSMLNPSDDSLKFANSKEHEKLQWINNVDALIERSIDQEEIIRVTDSLKGMIRGGCKEVSSARNQPDPSKFALNERDPSKYSKCCRMPSKITDEDKCEEELVGNNENGQKTVHYVKRKDRGESPEDSTTCFELKKTTSQKTNLARMGSKLEISRLKRLKDFIRIHRIDYGKLEFKERLALQWVESKDSRRPLQIDLSPTKTQENRPSSGSVPPPSSRFVPHFPPNRKFVYENRTCCLQESREHFVEPKVVGSFSEETLPFDSLFVPVPTNRKVESDKIRSNLWRFQNKREDNAKKDRDLPIFKSTG